MIDSFTGEYRFLSNFYPCKVVFDSITYDSVEHAYQAPKTLDLARRELIRDASTPGVAKRLGSKVKLRDDWEVVKCRIMYDLLKQKFRDPELRRKLLATGAHKLVEGNTWGDTYWGKCNGVGKNYLGKLLMYIRYNATVECV